MLSFFVSSGLRETDSLVEAEPWEFAPPADRLRTVREMPPSERKRWRSGKDMLWQVYSPLRGQDPARCIGVDNEVAGIRGVAFDYDSRHSDEETKKHLDQLPEKFRPTWMESTLGGKLRPVWVFEKELLVTSTRQAAAFLSTWADVTHARTLLAGWDDASTRPQQRWTNGGIWTPLGGPVAQAVVIDVFMAATARSAKVGAGEGDISLEVIADRVKEVFPGRWAGPFTLDATGVRFWDPGADAPAGCQVKKDGMLCFTGPKPFMSWADIFGHKWVDEQKNHSTAQFCQDIFWDDSRWYWRVYERGILPQRLSRDQVRCLLQERGVSGAREKGKTSTQLINTVNYIEEHNRFSGAAPLVNFPPGMVVLEDGRRLLNTSTLTPLPLLPGLMTPDKDFPWIWKFLHGLFAASSDGPSPTDVFMAWHKRACYAFRNYKQLVGQAIFLCGPAGNGKSLLCYRIVGPTLGGQPANPWPFWTAGTLFNSDLFNSFFWACNDEDVPKDFAARERVMAKLKGAVVNPMHEFSKKYHDTLSAVPHTGRFLGTLNDHPRSTGVLPEPTESTRDKMMFFGSQEKKDGFPAQHILEGTIRKELPYYLTWLERQYVPPDSVLEPGENWDTGRYGVRSYYDRRIELLAQTQGAAFNLAELIGAWCDRGVYWAKDARVKTWKGSATALWDELSNSFPTASRDWKIGSFSNLLLTLSSRKDSGVELVSDVSRLFLITRDLAKAAE